MIFFGTPELRRWLDLRYHGPIEATARFHSFFLSHGCSLLLGRMIKNYRAILFSDIGSLPVQGSRIMIRPENVEKLIVTDLRRIEFHFYGLSVSGFIGADISIGWIFLCPACVSHRRGQHALQIAEGFFHSPETACAECSFLRLHREMMVRLLTVRNPSLVFVD